MKIYCIKLILEIIPRNFLYFRLCSKLQSKMAKKKAPLVGGALLYRSYKMNYYFFFFEPFSFSLAAKAAAAFNALGISINATGVAGLLMISTPLGMITSLTLNA